MCVCRCVCALSRVGFHISCLKWKQKARSWTGVLEACVQQRSNFWTCMCVQVPVGLFFLKTKPYFQKRKKKKPWKMWEETTDITYESSVVIQWKDVFHKMWKAQACTAFKAHKSLLLNCSPAPELRWRSWKTSEKCWAFVPSQREC